MSQECVPRKKIKSVILLSSIGLFLIGGGAVASYAQYPARAIIINVGSDPGGGPGRVAMIWADGLSKHFPKPQRIIIDYKTGASGMIATDFVMKEPANGYNLLLLYPTPLGNMARNPGRYRYTIQDFSYLGPGVTSPSVIMVHKDSPFKTLEDLIDYAKKHPGELTFASGGIAGVSHISGEIFAEAAGIKLTHVPFSGGGAVQVAMLGKHVTIYPASAAGMSQHIKTGDIKVLAVLGSKRLPEFPDVPTCLEKGYDVGERGTWFTLVVRKGMPKADLDVLLKAFKETADDPNVKAALTKVDYIPMNMTPAETEKMVNKEFETFRGFFKKFNL